MALAALVLAASSLAFSVIALAIGRRELRALVPLRAQALDAPLLVVIPARNEPGIADCVARVLAEPSTDLRVIVVDDRSTDDTGARAAAACSPDARARVLTLTDDPPAGVFGKPRALAAGVAAASAADAPSDGSENVLCLDADVLLEPGALGALVEAKRRTRVAALSGIPTLETRTLTEALLVPTLAGFVTARFAPSRVHDANDATAFLNGQIVLVDRGALAAVGGWQSVQGTVLEDVALARRLKGAGHALALADMRSLARTRMYTSFRDVADGFGKNAVALLGARAGVLALFAVVTALLPWVAVGCAFFDSEVIEVTIALAIASIGCAWEARSLARVPRWPALVLPLVYGGAAIVLVRASLAHARGAPVRWKGRSYR